MQPSLSRFERRTGSTAASIPLILAGALAASLSLVYGRLPFTLAAIGFIALLAALPLVIVRYDAAVVTGIFLLGAVRFEPSPADAVFIIVILAALASGRFAVTGVPLAPVAGITAFFALNVLSAVFILDTHRAARFLGITLYLGIFSLWLTGYLRTAERVRRVVRAYVFAAVLSAALASAAYFFPFPQHDFFLEFGDRARGLFKDANVFGPFLIPAALFVLDDFLTPRLFGRSRAKKIAMFAILCLGVMLSFSRAGWLNLAVALAVYTIIVALRKNAATRLLRLFSVLLVLVAVVASVLVGTGALRFLQQRAAVQTYDTQRFGAQAEGLRLALQHPAGVGPGQFEVAEGQTASNEIVVGRPISAHSTYVRVLAEQGFLGIGVLVGLFAATLAMAGRSVVMGRRTFGLDSAPLLAAWCGLVVNSFVIDTLHWRHLWVIAAFIWAGAARAVPARVNRARIGAQQ